MTHTMHIARHKRSQEELCEIWGRITHRKMLRSAKLTNLWSGHHLLRNMVWRGCDLRNAYCNNAIMRHAVFEQCDLREAIFGHTDLQYATFINCRLGRAVFDATNAANARFIDCDIRNTHFYSTNLNNAAMIKCRITDTTFNSASMSDAMISLSPIENVAFPLGMGAERLLLPAESCKGEFLGNMRFGGAQSTQLAPSSHQCYVFITKGAIVVQCFETGKSYKVDSLSELKEELDLKYSFGANRTLHTRLSNDIERIEELFNLQNK